MTSSWLNNHLSSISLCDWVVILSEMEMWSVSASQSWWAHCFSLGDSAWRRELFLNHGSIFPYSPPVTEVTLVFILWAKRTPSDPVTGTSGSLVRKKEGPRATLHLTDVPSSLLPVFSLTCTHTYTYPWEEDKSLPGRSKCRLRKRICAGLLPDSVQEGIKSNGFIWGCIIQHTITTHNSYVKYNCVHKQVLRFVDQSTERECWQFPPNPNANLLLATSVNSHTAAGDIIKMQLVISIQVDYCFGCSPLYCGQWHSLRRWMDEIGVDRQLILGKWVWRSSSITSFREVLTARGQFSVARVNKMDVINLGNEELTILGKVSLPVAESLI